MQTSAVLNACEDGDYDGVASFINQGGDVNTKDVVGKTLLHVASKNGHVDIADLLLKQGCDRNEGTMYWSLTALHEACLKLHADIVSVLIKYGCDVRVRDDKGRTPLHMACCYWSAPISHPTDMEKFSAETEKLLAAIKNDDILEARFLLWSPFRHVEMKKSSQFFSMDMNRMNMMFHDGSRWECYPLLLATFLGKLKFVKILLDFDAGYIDFRDTHRRTALFYACQRGHLEVVQYLVKRWADINHRDDDGNTPLHEAVHFRRVEIVRELVASGADYNLKNHDNLSALDLVCQRMETTDEGKRRIHQEMLEIIDRQRELLLFVIFKLLPRRTETEALL